MVRVEEDPRREERIEMEIIVDCYDEHEAAMVWFSHLEDRLCFPFTARGVAEHGPWPSTASRLCARARR